jgi:peptide/nickel transport system permease protein
MTSATTTSPATSALVLPPRPRARRRRAARRYFRAHKITACWVALAAGFVVLALIGPAIAPHDPEVPDPSLALTGPSLSHPFGVDGSGFDIFSQALAAPRTDLGIAIAGTLIALAFGLVLGTLAGYYQGTRSVQSAAGETLMRVADVVQAFPIFILALGLVAMRGPGATNVIIALALVNFPLFLRLIRSETLALRERAFVDGARASGLSDMRIALKHILPNAIAPAAVLVSVNIGFGILLTAGLSYIGAGVRPPTPELGAMVSAGASTIVTGQWWTAVFPGIVIALVVLSFAFVGQAVEALLDPRSRT